MSATAVRPIAGTEYGPAPDRSLMQRLEALERANEIRSRRARFKRDVKAGRAAVVPMVAAPPDWLESMKVWDLLMCVPKYGRVKVAKVMGRHDQRISPSKTLGGLSDRQRAYLVALLRVRGVR